MARKRIAVIGCGFFSRNHLHSWSEIDQAEIVGVCDLDRQKAEAAAAQFGNPPSFTDAATMIDQTKPDLVDIITTMESHRSLVELCADRKIAVIVQKPFGPTMEDCLAMTDACSRAGVMLMVHENFRFQSAMRRIKQILDSDEIGNLVWGRISFRTGYDVKSGQPYLFNEEKLIVLDLGIHILDLARFFFGEVVTLYARLQRIDQRVTGEDMATIVLGHQSGATTIADFTYESQKLPDPFPRTLVTIEGINGAIDLRADLSLAISSRGESRMENVSTPLRSWSSEPWHIAQDSVFHTQVHALDALIQGYEPETCGSDNLRTYSLVDAAYRSAQSAEVVRL